MRVLYICHRIPYPPDKGDKIRAFHQIRAMSARHEVDLFTLADRTTDVAYRPALAPYCRRVTVVPLVPALARLRALSFLFSGKPLTVPYFYSAELNAEIQKAVLLRSYDRIFVYSSSMAQYVEWVDEVPALMDFVDVDSDKWMQYAAFARFPFSAVYRREGNRLREYERAVCEKFSSVLVSTEREAQLLRQISRARPVHVIPNGVDINYFHPLQGPPDATAPAVVFAGDMSYFPNEEAVIFFAHKVLPAIHRSMPDVRFLIVGREPGLHVRRLQKIEGVEVTGLVPDVRTYLAKARVSVAPFSIAAGIQNKILEAMACGLPVVATSRAIRGLSPSVAGIVETGNTAEELSAKTVRLLRDPQLARQKGMEGRLRVTAAYNWERNLDQLLQLLENPMGKDLSRTEAYSPSQCQTS